MRTSGFTDPTVVMKWEKWDLMDYTRRNLVGGAPLPAEPLQEVGIPLRYPPEGPKQKKTWVRKVGPIGDFFKDFVTQLAQQFIHTQLDKLTNDVHTRVVTGVEADAWLYIVTSLRTLPMQWLISPCVNTSILSPLLFL